MENHRQDIAEGILQLGYYSEDNKGAMLHLGYYGWKYYSEDITYGISHWR